MPLGCAECAVAAHSRAAEDCWFGEVDIDLCTAAALKGMSREKFAGAKPLSLSHPEREAALLGEPEVLLLDLTRVQDAYLFSGYTVLALAIGTALLYRRDAGLGGAT